jgi:hypothetical protein
MNATEKQLHRDAAYVQAYRAWISSLPSEQRSDLTARNLDAPDAKRSTGKCDDHVALSLISAPEPEAKHEATNMQADVRRAAADALSSFCARVRSHPNPLLAFDSLCFASGLMEVEGLPQTALAHRHGVTKAAFSRQVVRWIDLFDLPAPRGCRTLPARRSHRRARLAYVQHMKEISPNPEPVGIQPGRMRRYPSRAEDPTVVFIRGLDLFRLWFRRRTRRYPVEQWTPAARCFLRNELAWFKNLHDRLAQ